MRRSSDGHGWFSASCNATRFAATGTHESLPEASEFVRAIQHRQDTQTAYREENAWHLGWIDEAMLRVRAATCGNTRNGRYLVALLG